MKKITILILFASTLLVAQTHSDVKPTMFYDHQGEKHFVANVINEGDSAYTYQVVVIASYDQQAMLDALLNDYENSLDNISFAVYRERCIQRVSYALTNNVDITKISACGYEGIATKEEFLESLGLTNYRDK